MKSDNYNKKELLTELAKRVKTLRTERSLTQEDAYNDSGIHFGRIEQGKNNISFTTLYKICNYFDISLENFFENFYKK